MSREIKFRAWHKQAKSMASWEVMRELFFGKAVRWPLKLSNVRPYPETITYFEVRSANIFENLDLEVMQFTGLKDKNGREIYEGDIIESLWVVRWHDGHFVLDDHGAKEEFSAATVRHDAIVGNIYENPELVQASSTPEGAAK